MSTAGPRHRRTVSAQRYRVRRIAVGGVAMVVVAGLGFTATTVLGSSAPSAAAGSSTTTHSSSSTSTTITTAATTNDVSMSFVGDMDLGNTPQLPSNALHYLDPVKASLAAPIVFGNLEGTLTNASGSKCGSSSTNCYAFRNPPSFAAIYRYDGFNVLNSANNHAHDFGNQGVVDTSSSLKAQHIVQAGLPGQIGLIKAGSTRVAFVDFAPYSNTNDLLNFTSAAALIHQADTLAKVVVVYMHAGAEGVSADHVTGASEYFYGENRGNPSAFAHMAINAGASLVVASGPHVVRGMEIYHGHLIAYSLGDFVSYYNFATSGTIGLSGILHVTLHSNGAFVKANFTSVVLRGAGQPVLDPSHAAAHLVAQLSREDFGSRAPGIAANGTVVPPKNSVPKP